MNRVSILLVVCLACAACASAPRPQTTPGGGASWDPGIAMNPYILGTLVSQRLVVEVDWVEGAEPSPEAIRALEAALRRYCDPDKRIRIVLDDTIPATFWRDSGSRDGLETLVATHLDHDPGAWETEELLYVLYSPRSRPWYEIDVHGMSDSITFRRSGRIRTVRSILLFTERIRDDALLWIRPKEVERAILIHELGHALGLVGNPGHAQKDHSDHCSRAECVMSQAGLRSQLFNALPALVGAGIPSDFGERCREDLDAAKKIWDERSRTDPGYADELRRRRSRREALAMVAWQAAREP